MVKASNNGGKEIPIPGVVRIPTYRTDYVPTWRDRNTYIRPKGKRSAGSLFYCACNLLILFGVHLGAQNVGAETGFGESAAEPEGAEADWQAAHSQNLHGMLGRSARRSRGCLQEASSSLQPGGRAGSPGRLRN